MCFPQGKMPYSKQSQKRVPDHQRPVLSRTFISQPSLSRGATIDMLRLLWKQSNLRAPVLPVWLYGTLIARKTAVISSSVRGVFAHEYKSDSRAGTDRQ